MVNGEKVFIKHTMPIGSVMHDYFILSIAADSSYGYRKFIGCYWMSECEYAKKFLKKHPEYRYVGSDDDYTHRIRIPFGFKEFNSISELS